MSKKRKIWLIAAAVLSAVGLIIFTVAMSLNRWDFTELSTFEYESITYELNENFERMEINTDTADISVVASEDGNCRVTCVQKKKSGYSVSVEAGTLKIGYGDTGEWYDHIGVGFETEKVTVFLPKAEYESLYIKESTGDVKISEALTFGSADIILSTGDVDFSAAVRERVGIKTSTGAIRVENTTVGLLDLSVTTGEVVVSDISCKNLLSDGSTGALTLRNVIASELISIERSTGDVRLESSDAAEISVKTDTGDITGNLLSEKVYIAESSTGRVSVPKTVSGGKCELTASTGDIIFS